MATEKALINMSTLVRLADTDIEAQMVNLGSAGVSSELAAALAGQAAKRKKDNLEAAADEILNLNQNTDAFLAVQLGEKAKLQELIAGIDKVCAGVKRARDYGFAENNFLPLAAAIGMGIPAGVKKELKEVPKDWTAPVAAAA